MSFEPIPGGEGIPPEPDWPALYDDELDRASATDLWGSVIREMRAEATLTAANGHEIRRYVEFAIQYERAARHVAAHGAILKAAKAKIGQFNPYWAVMKHASEELRLLEGKLGISPTERGRATKVKREKKTQRASDRFLKSVS